MSKPDLLRMIFGFALLLLLATLCVIIALGKVEESTSYGLMPLVTTLAALGGGFANWAFGAGNKSDKDKQ